MDNRRDYGERPRRKNSIRKRRKSKILWGRLSVFILCLCLVVVGLCKGAMMAYDYFTTPKEVVETTVAPITPPPETERKYMTIELPDASDGKPIYILLVGLSVDHDQEIASLFLVSFNRVDQRVDLIGIPTGSIIKSKDQQSIETIASIYQKGNLQLTKAVVEDLFHVDIPYFVIYNEYSFQKAMAQIGTFPFYIEKNIQQYDESGQDISLARGYQTMTPEKAWGYMVYKSPEGAGENQVQRQERLFKAVFQHMADKSVITRGYDVYKLWENFQSNISPWDATKLDNLAKDYNSINYYVLPGVEDTLTDERKIYWEINPTDIPQILGGSMNGHGGTDDE